MKSLDCINYINEVGTEHRKIYAQYFTPVQVALFMRRWLSPNGAAISLLDPAFGLGAFWEAKADDSVFLGIDIDSKIIDYYNEHTKKRPAGLHQANYLLSFGKTYKNIICNPPYLKFQKFDNKEEVIDAIQTNYGVKLSGYTNIASAFLLKSLFELENGGRLAYIMPSEFLNTGYGKKIKEHLIAERHLAHLIQIECEQEAFPDATTSLCIILYDSAKPYNSVSFYSVSNLNQLDSLLSTKPVNSVSYEELRPNEKWGLFFKRKASVNDYYSSKTLVQLSYYGHFARGIATGANEFFVLRKSEIAKLSLQLSDYSCCITKSMQINKPVFTQDDFNLLSSQDAPVYLFNVSQTPSSSAASYIRYGEAKGYNNGYITQNRSPWYKMEKRDPAPILLNVFSRNGYKVVRNLSSVQSLTSFHCFYPNLFGLNRINALFLFLFSNVGHSILSASIRKYGNNLEKFEPNDLNNALVPSEEFLDGIPAAKINDIMDGLALGHDLTKEIDSLFEGLIV